MDICGKLALFFLNINRGGVDVDQIASMELNSPDFYFENSLVLVKYTCSSQGLPEDQNGYIYMYISSRKCASDSQI